MSYQELVRDEYLAKSLHEVLEEPTTALLGVSASVASVLKDLGIRTVFDLAHSQLFHIATAFDGNEGVFREFGRVPSDFLNEGEAGTVDELKKRSPTVLRGISEEFAGAMSNDLGISTLREMAVWPPFLAARHIALSALQPEALANADPEAPKDLLPSSGDYPSERFTYQSLVLMPFTGDHDGGGTQVEGGHEQEDNEDTVPRQENSEPSLRRLARLLGPGLVDAGQKAEPLRGGGRQAAGNGRTDLVQAGRLRLADLDGALVTVPLAQGALLTWSHSWYRQGVTLGQLLHSVALAPGETTRIAMIDWSRRTSASTTESIDQAEQLSNTMDRTRAISEVHQTVARETQSGKSGGGARSTSEERGVGAGGLLPTPGLGLLGASYGTASSASQSWAWSTSHGQRDITNEMTQNITDSTQQAASSTRTRRASIIREVSTSESERVTTRAVTNYNHMHALSVQYYEIVQAYRTVVELQTADRCLFVPIEPLDFSDAGLVQRFRHPLASAALTPEVAQALLSEPNDVTITAPLLSDQGKDVEPWDVTSLTVAAEQLRYPVGPRPMGTAHLPADTAFDPSGHFDITENELMPRFVTAYMRNGEEWRIVREAQPENNTWPVGQDGQYHPVRIADMQMLELTAMGNEDGTTTLPGGFTARATFRAGNDSFKLGVRAAFDPPAGSAYKHLRFSIASAAVLQAEVRDHLDIHRDHYSAAVWRDLSATQLAALLARYDVGGIPLIELVDPAPVGVAGPYIVLRMPLRDGTDQQAWRAALVRHNVRVGDRREDTVPLPSGGVFAEAVLGRFNSAEKVDLTRFWNWQDSPIPVTAPEIAPVSTGSRGSDDPGTPGSLDAPLVQQMQAPNLPDPNFAAALAVLGQSNMFRDMSGLAQTAALAGTALGATSAGAGRAAAQAGTNMATVAEFAAQIAAAALTGGASPPLSGLAGGKAKTVTEAAGWVNVGRDNDSKLPTMPVDASNTAGQGDGEGVGSSTGRLVTGYSGSHGVDAFRSAGLGIPAAVPSGQGDEDPRQRSAPVLASTRSMELPTFSPDEIVIEDEEARAILIYFWPEYKSDIESAVMTHAAREKAQGMIIRAVESSRHISFVQRLAEFGLGNPARSYKSIAKSIAKVVKKALEKGWFEDIKAVPEQNPPIYNIVLVLMRASTRTFMIEHFRQRIDI